MNVLEADILFFIAIAIAFGFLSGKAVNYLKLPAVVGYLVAGLLLGPSFLHGFSADWLDRLDVFTNVALSLVAFIIGSQMRLETLREMGRGIGLIILLESFGAFAAVACGVYMVTGSLPIALIFGAIAPASAPAGTVAVLEECKAKGRLTNALYTVVGLDDGLAIIIFAAAAALAKLSISDGSTSVLAALFSAVVEIVGSIALGCLIGAATGYFIRKLRVEQGVLAVSLAGIFACSGLANYLGFSLILANLSLGMVFVNLYQVANKKAYRAIESISLPIYIIFFFIAGAELQVKLLLGMGAIGVVYILCRIAGLMGGAWLGAVISKQGEVIRKYLGLGILSQAGVAIGLAVLAASRFESVGQAGRQLAITVVNIVAASTIFFEVIGPICTRYAITKAGEAGANITEEDLINTYKVADVMDMQCPAIAAGAPLSEVIKMVSDTDEVYYPVVDDKGHLVGALTLDGIRRTFATQELNDWLVALDITEPIRATIGPEVPLSEAIERARSLDIEQMPVVEANEDHKLVGLLDLRAVHRRLHAEVLARQQRAYRT